MSRDAEAWTVVTATALETVAARRILRAARVRRGGVRVRRGSGRTTGGMISCGLCGALAPLAAGTVVVPDEVVSEEGVRTRCDAAMVAALRAAARSLGYAVDSGPLLGAGRVVRGEDRARLATGGVSAVDMETAVMAATGRPLAAVRVVLDTPDEDLSEAWATPARVLLRPWLWPEAARLGVHGWRWSLRAAEVAEAALRSKELGGSR